MRYRCSSSRRIIALSNVDPINKDLRFSTLSHKGGLEPPFGILLRSSLDGFSWESRIFQSMSCVQLFRRAENDIELALRNLTFRIEWLEE